MEDIIDPGAGLAAGSLVTDIALNETESLPGFRRDPTLNLVQIALMSGGEIIQANNPLPQLQQGFEQIGADEAGNAGHQPGGGLLFELFLPILI
jgi:hypothetical protein